MADAIALQCQYQSDRGIFRALHEGNRKQSAPRLRNAESEAKLIPRMIAVPYETEIRPQFCWAALVLAHQHKIDQAKEGKSWTCACRCCRWARTHSNDKRDET